MQAESRGECSRSSRRFLYNAAGVDATADIRMVYPNIYDEAAEGRAGVIAVVLYVTFLYMYIARNAKMRFD